ncbi:MAG TPA: nuclear transport factor 2 family protein [Gemmatimonadales bacterium]|nr:nuclear transport factor 2 family protein [Gemmatimonadales bacterium]
MRQTVRLMVMGGLVMAAACAPKPADTAGDAAAMEADAAAAKTAIAAVDAQFMAHFNAGHADSVAAFYSEDGRIMAPNAPAAVGRPAIAAALAPMAAAKPNLVLTTVSVEVHGPLAVELGTYTLTLSPPGAKQPVSDNGKYLVQWRKVGDKWMLVNDIWNSDQMAMPMPSGQ